MSRTIVKIIVFLLAFLPMPNAFSQEGEGNPYACLGDESPVRDIVRQTEVSKTRVFIVLSDTVRAEIHIEGDRLIVIDTGGKERGTYKIDFSSRALFSVPDPKASEMPWVSPYVYCFGNPIHFIDETGERPSEYEAAMMADAAYVDNLTMEYIEKNYKDLSDAGWCISQYSTSIQMNYTKLGENGLQSVLFERSVDGVTEYAYAYAGTESLEDIVEDISQLGGIAPQYTTAIYNARTLSDELGNNELTFIGHSLGGGEAAASSMATGRAAITFNPAAVSPLTQKFHNLGSASAITNYRIIPPQTSGINIGGCFVNNLQDNLGMSAPGNTIRIEMPIRNPIRAHSLSNFIDYFRH